MPPEAAIARPPTLARRCGIAAGDLDQPSRFGVVTVLMHAEGVGLEGEWEEGRPPPTGQGEHGGTGLRGASPAGWCPLKPR